MSNQSLALFAFGGISEESVKALTRKDAVSKAGRRSQSVRVGNKTELGKIIGTKNKDAIAEFELKTSDELMRLIRAELGGIDADKWTGLRRDITENAQGGQDLTIKLRSVVRVKITAEKIAKEWGITIEEAQEIIKKNCRIASPIVEVKSEIVPPAQLSAPPATETPQPEEKAPELTQEEKDAAELAKLEREEQEKQAKEQAELVGV